MSDAIRTRIDLLRGRVHGAELARTVGRAVTTLVVGLLLWLLVDYWVVTTIFGTGWWDICARLALDGTLAWFVAAELRGGLLAELKRRRHDDELAMRLEATHPELGGRLISTVQLMRDLEAGELRKIGSPGLVEALAEETQAQAESVDHRRAWDIVPAKRAVLIGAVLLLIALGLAIWRHDIAGAFARRLAMLSAHYPTATRITAVKVPALVGRGDPVAVEVEVDPTSRVPAEAEATLRDAEGHVSTMKLERVAGEKGRVLYRGILQQAVEDLTVRLRAGDHRWEQWQNVRVQRRPAVKELKLRLVYPAYLKKAATETSVGDIEVPVGTKVEVRAVLSRAVAKAELALRTGAEAPVPAVLALGNGGAEASGDFTVTSDGSWAIGLVDGDGLDAGDTPHWGIVAVPDRAPTISASFPPRDADVTRVARWPIRYLASDDHGIARIRLRWLVIPPGGDIEAVTGEPGALEAQDGHSDGSVQIHGEIPFDLTPLNLPNDARVVWWLEAQDAKVPDPNVTQSQRGTFTVVDLAEMRERMLRERADLIDSVKGIRDHQREAQDGVDAVRKVIKK